MIFLELQELKDISVPWFKVHGKRSLSLTTALIDVSSGLIEDLEHGKKPIGDSIRTLDVSSLSSDFMDSETNTSGSFGNQCSLV